MNPPPLQGVSVEDATYLDGSRHLSIEASDESGAWTLLLNLVLDRDLRSPEGDCTIDGPGTNWSGGLRDVLELEPAERLRLRARFGDAESAGQGVNVEAQEDESGGYSIVVRAD